MKRKLILAGAAFCTALFLFSGFMLCRQYIDDKKSAESQWIIKYTTHYDGYE